MSDEEETTAVVIDNGSYTIQAGFASEDAPRSVFPSLVGHLENPVPGVKNFYVGDEAQAKKNSLSRLVYPIERGIPVSWDSMEKIWDHTFYNELAIAPNEVNVLGTESGTDGTKANREKAIEIMFETFGVLGYHVYNSSVLALYASGRTSGMILCSGDRHSVAMPIYMGYALPHAIRCNDIGGAQLTEWFAQNLNLKTVTKAFTLELAEDIKEKLGYIALDYGEEIEKATAESDVQYELPDGQTITIGTERFEGPEMMFKPNMVNMDTPGVHEMIRDSVMNCDLDIRRDLWENIVLTGGNTMFRNIGRRLKREMKKTSHAFYVNVVTPGCRKYSSWIGGSILASLSTFEEMWISADEYNEFGPSIVHRRCT